MSKFKQIMYIIFIIFPQSLWLSIKLLTILGFIFSVAPTRNALAKRKVKRTLIKEGMPPKEAKKIAKTYGQFLINFGSLRGIMRLVLGTWRTSRKVEENKTESKLLPDSTATMI